MLEAYFRPLYESILVNPIAKWVKHLAPETITFSSCISGMLVMPLLFFNLPAMAIAALLISGLLDSLDGTVARINGKTSEVGSVLDILSDRVVELSVFIGLYAVDPIHRSWQVFSMLGSCYLCISIFLMMGIFIPNRSQKGFHFSPGLIERAEAFFFFILMMWMPKYFTVLAVTFTLLVLITSYMHYRKFVEYKRERLRFNHLR